MSDTATIFNIQRYSVHDGPGIRTLVFFKGCPLRCIWCSNPEGINPKPQVKYIKMKCNGCGKCVDVCPENAIKPTEERGLAIDPALCSLCGKCAEVCPTQAKAMCGETYSLEGLFKRVKRDAVFYKASGGGVTLGGGDPLMQPDFAEKFLALCQENGLDTAIETEAYCSFDALAACAAHCNTIHIDLKGWDEATHKEVTAVSNKRILENIKKLDEWLDTREEKPLFIVRLPMLPDTNFRLEDMPQVGAFLKSLKNLSYAEILPFHNLGEHKYEQIGLSYPLYGRNNLKSEDVAEFAEALREAGVTVKVTDW